MQLSFKSKVPLGKSFWSFAVGTRGKFGHIAFQSLRSEGRHSLTGFAKPSLPSATDYVHPSACLYLIIPTFLTIGGGVAAPPAPNGFDMSISRKQALKYGYEVVSRPKSKMSIQMCQDSKGIVLTYDGQPVTRTYLTKSGMAAASAIAIALALPIPSQGQSIEVTVSTGALHRLLALSEISFRNEAAFRLATVLIEEVRDMLDIPMQDDNETNTPPDYKAASN